MEDKITVFNVKSYNSFWGDDAPFKTHFDDTEMRIDFGYDLDDEAANSPQGVVNIYKYDANINPDVVILHDRVSTLKCWKKLRQLDLLSKTVFLLNESGAVDWKCGSFFLKHFTKTFPAFLTYRDDYVNDRDVLKMYVTGSKIKEIDWSTRPFNERKLLCVICAKKKSHFKHEMYSERLRNIKYFEEHPEVEFDLYGAWWGNGFRNWRGMIPNKKEAYHDHKYALCIENSNEKGYITEKIFDCFRFGIVPVYAGPDNVGDYLPSGAYIDYYRFSDPGEMVRYLEQISEGEYGTYLDAANEYIVSNKTDVMYDERTMIDNCVRSISNCRKRISPMQIQLVGLIDGGITIIRRSVDIAISILRTGGEE